MLSPYGILHSRFLVFPDLQGNTGMGPTGGRPGGVTFCGCSTSCAVIAVTKQLSSSSFIMRSRCHDDNHGANSVQCPCASVTTAVPPAAPLTLASSVSCMFIRNCCRTCATNASSLPCCRQEKQHEHGLLHLLLLVLLRSCQVSSCLMLLTRLPISRAIINRSL